MNKNNKNALVTGATSGIGFCIAERLIRSGHNVIVHGIDKGDSAIAAVERLASITGVQSRYIAADLATEAGCNELLNAVADTNIDILINNAGFQHTANIDEFPTDVWQRMVAVNLTAPFILTSALMGGMKERDYGRVINIASVHGLVASRNKVGYCATKHGLVGLTKAAALDCATHNITVNAICPGWVETPLMSQQISDLAKAQSISYDEAKFNLLSAKQPKAEATPCEAVAGLVNYLVSDEANTITGAAMPIDGGWVAQ